MAYKSILTVVHDTGGLGAVLGAASALAQSQNGHLAVLAVNADEAQIPVFSYGYGDSFAAVQIMLEEAQTSRSSTEAAVKALLKQENPSLRWSVDSGDGQFGNMRALVAQQAMFSDIVVLPQPCGTSSPTASEAILEAVLFDGSAPVLIIPAEAQNNALIAPQFGKRVIIGWDQSREAMTAVRRALPFLIAADQVSIVIIDPPVVGPERSDPGGQLCQMLVRHGVQAEVTVLARATPRISDSLLRHVRDQGADLLVIGAYGHSRLREAILGGATRDVLKNAKVPVLLAH